MTAMNDPVQPSLLEQILAGTITNVAENKRFAQEHIDGISALISSGTLTQDRLTAVLTASPKDEDNEDH